MATINAMDRGRPPAKPDRDELNQIVRLPGGTHRILEMARDGEIDPDEAIEVIDRFERRPLQLLKRVAVAITNGLLRS